VPSDVLDTDGNPVLSEATDLLLPKYCYPYEPISNFKAAYTSSRIFDGAGFLNQLAQEEASNESSPTSMIEPSHFENVQAAIYTACLHIQEGCDFLRKFVSERQDLLSDIGETEVTSAVHAEDVDGSASLAKPKHPTSIEVRNSTSGHSACCRNAACRQFAASTQKLPRGSISQPEGYPYPLPSVSGDFSNYRIGDDTGDFTVTHASRDELRIRDRDMDVDMTLRVGPVTASSAFDGSYTLRSNHPEKGGPNAVSVRVTIDGGPPDIRPGYYPVPLTDALRKNLPRGRQVPPKPSALRNLTLAPPVRTEQGIRSPTVADMHRKFEEACLLEAEQDAKKVQNPLNPTQEEGETEEELAARVAMMHDLKNLWAKPEGMSKFMKAQCPNYFTNRHDQVRKTMDTLCYAHFLRLYTKVKENQGKPKPAKGTGAWLYNRLFSAEGKNMKRAELLGAFNYWMTEINEWSVNIGNQNSRLQGEIIKWVKGYQKSGKTWVGENMTDALLEIVDKQDLVNMAKCRNECSFVLLPDRPAE